MHAQNCYPEKRKDKKLTRKIEKLIKKRNYYSATDLLKNLRDVSYLYVLKSEILFQLTKKKYKRQNIYGNGSAAKKMVKILSNINLNIEKKITY